MSIEHGSFLQNAYRGNYTDVSTDHKYSYAPAVGTTEKTVWSALVAADVSYPTAPITAYLSSSSTDDDAAGTGALTVKIWYYPLSTSTELSTATLTMLGQLSDGVGISLWRIHRMKVMTAGDGDKNAGQIYLGSGTITTGVPAVVYGVIAANDSDTQQSFMWVPIGKTCEIHHVVFSVSTGKDARVAFFHRLAGNNVWHRGDTYEVNQTVVEIDMEIPAEYLAGTDIEVRAYSSGANSFVGSNFDYLLRPETPT